MYKMVDGLADVYEGRGCSRWTSCTGRRLTGVPLGSGARGVLVVLLITRNLPVACIVMAVAAALSFVVLTFPLALFETPKSRRVSPSSVARLLKQCFSLFSALFLYALIDNMPKFVMEGVLPTTTSCISMRCTSRRRYPADHRVYLQATARAHGGKERPREARKSTWDHRPYHGDHCGVHGSDHFHLIMMSSFSSCRWNMFFQ